MQTTNSDQIDTIRVINALGLAFYKFITTNLQTLGSSLAALGSVFLAYGAIWYTSKRLNREFGWRHLIRVEIHVFPYGNLKNNPEFRTQEAS